MNDTRASEKLGFLYMLSGSLDKILSKKLRNMKPETILLVALLFFFNKKAVNRVKAILPSWAVQSF
jgi:hypothetical protein